MKKILTILLLVSLTGCANLQSNIQSGLTTLTKDVNTVAVDAGQVGQDAITVGTTAVTLGTDTVKVAGVIATGTAPKPAPAASTGT